MEFYLGVDGGQSSTVVLVGDDKGRVVGAARGGPCNHVSGLEGRAKFVRVVGGCIREACSAAGLDPTATRFEAACLGMSGGAEDKLDLLSHIIRTEHLLITTDGEIALTGATGGRPGIVVIAGTGSIAFGRNSSGELRRAGGWGYVFGDEGGAFDIVRQALRACLRFEEGWGTGTALLPALLEAAGARNANELLHLFYGSEWPRSRVAALAELVDGAGESGDPIARGILEQAGQSLASLAGCLRAQLFADGSETMVSFVGGVFRSRIVRERFCMLVELAQGSHCAAPEMSPAAGALLDAYRAAGREVTVSQVPTLK